MTLAAAVFMIVAVAGCSSADDPSEERLRLATDPEADVVIGAAWPWSTRETSTYWQGMELALREVNAAGGILGRTVRIKKGDDRESVVEGRLVAKRFVEDPEVMAVIGHLNSHVTLPASTMYDAGGVLMLTPASTSPEITSQGLRRVFRSVNNDAAVGDHMARFAQLEGYEQVAIVYVRNAYGLGLANAFEISATDADISVVGRTAYDASTNGVQPNFDRLIDGLGDLDADAIFLAGMAPEAGYLIADVRKAGIDIPIFGGDALDTEDLIEAAGEAANGVVIASVFHPDNPRQEVQNFNEAFRAEYGTLPDSWAARGYEALKLLVHAMNDAGSVVPDRVADALRSLDGWSGLTGTFVFDDHGDVVGKEVMTVVVEEGRFRFRGEQQAVSSSYDRDREQRSEDLQWVNTRIQ